MADVIIFTDAPKGPLTVRGQIERAIANFKDTLALDDELHFLSKSERRARVRQIAAYERELANA